MRIPPLLMAGLLFIHPVHAGAVTAPLPGTGSDDPLLGHYDIRILGKAELDRVAAAYASPTARKTADVVRTVAEPMQREADLLRARVPGARVELSPVGSGVEVVSAGGAPLSAPAPGQDGASIVRGFLRAHAAVWGLSPEQVEHLEIRAESTTGGSRTVSLRQTVHGRPVFQSDSRAILDADGRLLQVVGRLVPGIDESTVPEAMDITPAEALRSAMRTVGVPFDTNQVRKARALEGARQELAVESKVITRPVTSEAVYFPLGPGLVVPAWSQVTFTRGPSDWYTVVDARTGTVRWRKDIRYHVGGPDRLPAKFKVFLAGDCLSSTPAASPAPTSAPLCTNNTPNTPNNGQHQRISLCSNIQTSGWVDGPKATATTTGNNVDVLLDRSGDDVDEFRPTPANRNSTTDDLAFSFDFNPPPMNSGTDCDPDHGALPAAQHPEADPSKQEYQEGALTQLFYLVNWFHDRLYELGFKEEDGNFQESNDGKEGLEKDRIRAEAQYGADDLVKIFNLASFSAPPDGTPGILRLSLWNGPQDNSPGTPPKSPRDASLDAEVVFHELAHGVTSRMICNGAGLNWFPGRALAEGWSDFYALALLNPAGGANGSHAFGSYTAYKLGGHADFTKNYEFGMRRYSYATKGTKTLAGAPVNPLTWADTDDTTDCFTDPQAPCNRQPSTLGWENFGANEIHNAGELWAASLWEMRSALIVANGGDTTAGNQAALQIVTKALEATPCDPSFLQARDAVLAADQELFSTAPHTQAIKDAFSSWGLGPIARDSGGFAAHYGIFPDFGNGTAPPPGQGSNVAFPLVTCQCSEDPSVGCTQGDLKLADNQTIIGSFKCGFVKSGRDDCMQGSGQNRQERPSCIPDGYPLGKTFTLTLSDPSNPGAVKVSDLKVGNLEFRIGELTHPWVGDLTVMLKGPNGYGTDLIYRLPQEVTILSGGQQISLGPLLGMNQGGCLGTAANPLVVTGQNGKDFFSEDGLSLAARNNCFSGIWSPILNSRTWFTFDGEDQLSHFEGSDLIGEWTLFVSDVVPDPEGGGKLVSWSLLITPKTINQVPAVAGTQKALGDLTAGHTVTYKLVLSNPGKGDLRDGPGPEFREVLPPELALIASSVRANRGQASLEGNAVIWNGSLPPGGKVRLTFDARIGLETVGKTVSSQGRLRYSGGTGAAEAVTDDPVTPEHGDANRFVVRPPA